MKLNNLFTRITALVLSTGLMMPNPAYAFRQESAASGVVGATLDRVFPKDDPTASRVVKGAKREEARDVAQPVSDYLAALANEESDLVVQLKVMYRDEWENRRERLVTALQRFQTLYPNVKKVVLARAPGRITVNEHTDYNDAVAMGMPTLQDDFVIAGVNDESSTISIQNMEDGRFKPFTLGMSEVAGFAIPKVKSKAELPWSTFVIATLKPLFKALHTYREAVIPTGLAILFDGREEFGGVPIESNISSSAALEESIINAVEALSGIPGEMTGGEVIEIGRNAEASIGFPCGKLDQGISTVGRARVRPGELVGGAIDTVPRLDAQGRDLTVIDTFVLPSAVEAVLVDTGAKDRATEEYNKRVIEGEIGSWILAQHLNDLVPDFLSQVDPEKVQQFFGNINPDHNGRPYLYDANRLWPVFLKPAFFSGEFLRKVGVKVSDAQLQTWLEKYLPRAATKEMLLNDYNVPAEFFETVVTPARSVPGLSPDTDSYDLLGTVRHAIGEEDRAPLIKKALADIAKATSPAEQAAALRWFGSLEVAGYESLRDDYRNSSARIDALISWASAKPWFLAGRHFGAGWGGWLQLWIKPGTYDAAQADVKVYLKGEQWFQEMAKEKQRDLETALTRAVMPYKPGAPANVLARTEARDVEAEVEQMAARLNASNIQVKTSPDGYLFQKPLKLAAGTYGVKDAKTTPEIFADIRVPFKAPKAGLKTVGTVHLTPALGTKGLGGVIGSLSVLFRNSETGEIFISSMSEGKAGVYGVVELPAVSEKPATYNVVFRATPTEVDPRLIKFFSYDPPDMPGMTPAMITPATAWKDFDPDREDLIELYLNLAEEFGVEFPEDMEGLPTIGAVQLYLQEIGVIERTEARGVETRVKEIIAEQLGVNPVEVTPDADIVIDLAADEVQLINLWDAIEVAFGLDISDEDSAKLNLFPYSFSRTAFYNAPTLAKITAYLVEHGAAAAEEDVSRTEARVVPHKFTGKSSESGPRPDSRLRRRIPRASQARSESAMQLPEAVQKLLVTNEIPAEHYQGEWYQVAYETAGSRKQIDDNIVVRHMLGFADMVKNDMTSRYKLKERFDRGDVLVIAYDNRPAQANYARLTASVAVALGFKVKLIATPMPGPVAAEMSRKGQNVIATILFTASHNPMKRNKRDRFNKELDEEEYVTGLKFFVDNAPQPDVLGKAIEKVANDPAHSQYNMIPLERLPEVPSDRLTIITDVKPILEESLKRIWNAFDGEAFKAAIAAYVKRHPEFMLRYSSIHGAMGLYAKMLFNMFGIPYKQYDLKTMDQVERDAVLRVHLEGKRVNSNGELEYWKPDPTQDQNWSPKWKSAVMKGKPGDLFMMNDGDGDRLVMMEAGMSADDLNPNKLILILQDHLTRRLGFKGPVSRTVPTSRGMDAHRRAMGLPKPIVVPVGSRNFPYEDEVLDGEESGHMNIRMGGELFVDNGVVNGLAVLHAMVTADKMPTELLAEAWHFITEKTGVPELDQARLAITKTEVTPSFQDFVVWLRTEGEKQQQVRESLFAEIASAVGKKLHPETPLSTVDILGVGFAFEDETGGTIRNSGTEVKTRNYAEFAKGKEDPSVQAKTVETVALRYYREQWLKPLQTKITGLVEDILTQPATLATPIPEKDRVPLAERLVQEYDIPLAPGYESERWETVEDVIPYVSRQVRLKAEAETNRLEARNKPDSGSAQDIRVDFDKVMGETSPVAENTQSVRRVFSSRVNEPLLVMPEFAFNKDMAGLPLLPSMAAGNPVVVVARNTDEAKMVEDFNAKLTARGLRAIMYAMDLNRAQGMLTEAVAQMQRQTGNGQIQPRAIAATATSTADIAELKKQLGDKWVTIMSEQDVARMAGFAGLSDVIQRFAALLSVGKSA